jgi:hypothetical protein
LRMMVDNTGMRRVGALNYVELSCRPFSTSLAVKTFLGDTAK